MPHRFLQDSRDSRGIQCIPEEYKLAESPANIDIPFLFHSGGICSFWNWYWNVPQNSLEQNATGMHLLEWYLIYNQINILIDNYNID